MKKRRVMFAVAVWALTWLTGCATDQDLMSSNPDDQRLAVEVRSQLQIDPVTDDEHIGVRVENKIVTLYGWVSSAQVKARAVTIARGTPNILGVKDNITYDSIAF